MKDAQHWIDRLELEPHPEGGYFREVFRSPEPYRGGFPGRSFDGKVEKPTARFSGPRSLMTSIYFLLRAGQVSRLHRLLADEVWLFHGGTPVNLHLFAPDGSYQCRSLGPDPEAGQAWQITIPHGHWFGATLLEPARYGLVSCIMAPGFEFADFELGRGEDLLKRYPRQAEIIRALT